MTPAAVITPGGGVESGAASTADSYTVQPITSIEQFLSMADTWNALLLDSGMATIFLSWEWLFTWTNCFVNSDRSLFVLGIYHANEIIGLAPFYLQKVKHKLVSLREIRFLGSPDIGSDYLDVISRSNCEKQVADIIYDYLFRHAHMEWDELHLTDIPAESHFLLHFMNRVEADGKFKEVHRCAVMPQTVLPDSADAFYAGLSSKRRSRLRQDMRRLCQQGETEHFTYSAMDFQQGLDRFFGLYDTKSEHNSVKLYPFLCRLGEFTQARNSLQIDILCSNGRDVAGLLHLRYGKRLFLLLMVVDKQFNRKISLGNLLVCKCMQNAVADGIRLYDFLKGDEEYKFHWASHTRASLSVILDQHHLPSILATIGRLGKYAIKTILR